MTSSRFCPQFGQVSTDFKITVVGAVCIAFKPTPCIRVRSREVYRVGGYAKLGCMSHTIRDQKKLLARVRRIRGQVEGIERALESKAGCEQVMHLIAGARGAMAGLMAEIVEDHVRSHLVDADRHPGALNPEAADSLLDVVRTYLK